MTRLLAAIAAWDADKRGEFVLVNGNELRDAAEAMLAAFGRKQP